MLKIGLFTFGGGYAMIALLENEFVSQKKWLEKEEFLDTCAPYWKQDISIVTISYHI